MKIIRITTRESSIFEVPDGLETDEQIDSYLEETEEMEQDVVDSEEYSSHSYTVSKDEGETWDLL